MVVRADQVDIRGSRILIVDDQKQNIALLRDLLSDLGYRLSFALSGKDAFEVALNSPPDLILMDMNMPGMDGVLTSELFKKDERLRHIPIIFVTANQDISSLVRAFEAGASDFITKPVKQEELAARTRAHLLVSAFQKALSAANEKLESLAKTDQLTGVHNRRSFEERALLEWNRARRDGSYLGMLMIDIDHFKLYNDHYGHQAGDLALSVAAHTMQETLLRATDFVARYGGEEFVVVLPDTNLEGVRIVGQRIVSAIRELEMPHEKSASNILTVSVGAVSRTIDADASLRTLVKQADKALYQAKAQGRNRLCYPTS